MNESADGVDCTAPAGTAPLPEVLPAVILGGGQSRRMGRDKLMLPLPGGTMYSLAEDALASIATHLIVVIGKKANPPASLRNPIVVRDEQPGIGPMEGLRVGLRQCLELGAEMAMISTGDAPLVVPGLFRHMVRELVRSPELKAVVPRIDGAWHPLTAVYRTSVIDEIEFRIERGLFKARDLVAAVNARPLTRDDMISIDPQLNSLRNVNTPDEYAALCDELNARSR